MYQKDYILQMLEMLTDLIAGILGLIKNGNHKNATKALENAYYDYLKQDSSFFQNISKTDLTNKLLNGHNYNTGHLEILSELFYAQAELYQAQDDLTESPNFYEKSLILLDFVNNESKSYSFEKQSKISTLQSRIDQLKSVS
jgi:hypothetical protein